MKGEAEEGSNHRSFPMLTIMMYLQCQVRRQWL